MSVKVLVVEDEPDLEFLISRRFRKRIRSGELQFLFARNGLEALKILESDPDVFVALSDIRMPEMDGLALLIELNKRYPLLRTVIVSAYGDMQNIRTAMNRGAYDFLTKPIDFKDLEATLDKTIKHVYQFIHEITERKKAEKEVLQLKKAVETMQLGVTIADLEGKILYTNPADARMHGYRVEDLIGKDVGIFAPPGRRQQVSLEKIRKWKGLRRESLNIRKDGSMFPVWLMSEIVRDVNGEPTVIVTSCEDITERKRAEEELKKHRDHLEELVEERTEELVIINEELQQEISERRKVEVELLEAHKELQEKNAQLQELNIGKDKFFSIISHDLRSPFNVMLGLSQFLYDNADRFTTEEIKARLSRLKSSAEQLYALLENLLTWSRIQRGAMEHTPGSINIYEIAEDNFNLFTSKAEHKQITLKNFIDRRTLVYADYNMINTVFRNLISNAIKFTDAGGRIEVSAQPHNEQHIEIVVADTGTGIDKEDIPKLFRIDVQHTNLGTAGEIGTGLGLNLCKELVEKNGGTIWVESEVEEGTVFRFTLPKAAG